ncbi:MAG: hypothetical protein H7Y11_04760, partial [Armatimonadetes bacterium]|nr:hypothetical protein [Anaerolineae bacterium]
MKRLATPFLFVMLVALSATAPTISAMQACPVNLAQRITRALRACTEVDRNTACYGNGAIFIGVTAAADDPDMIFANPGDQMPIGTLTFISTSSVDDSVLTAEQWGIARLEVQANLLAEQPQRSSTLWLMGKAILTNRSPVVPELVATASGTLNLRTLPAADADIITQLGLRDAVIANGRTDDNRWLRVFVPRTETLAWVGAEVVTLTGDLNTLDMVTPDTPYERPFQVA